MAPVPATNDPARLGYWRHRTANSVGEARARLRTVTWEEAQPWCNFVVLRPADLPPGLRVENLSLRPEAPPGRSDAIGQAGRPDWHEHNRCSFRFEVVGAARRLRVKQFLYDWAPPAFDHPCLWKSRNEPFAVGKNLGWLGTDYRKARGAAVSIARTTVELSVSEGAFPDEELRALCRGLGPVDRAAGERILATPLADLCYQSRHRETVIAVPCGYFAHQRVPPTLELTPLRAEAAPAHLPGRDVAPPAEYGFRLDSVFVYGPVERPQEADYLYEKGDPPGCYLRLLVSPADQPGGVRYPPRPDLQPCSTEVRSVRGQEVHHAFLTERYGPHEAVWQAGGRNFMLLTKPSLETTADWFAGLLRQMMPG
jgi:hypothetical protein